MQRLRLSVTLGALLGLGPPLVLAQVIAPIRRNFLPRNKMTLPGLKKEEDTANVIAYLAGFSADGRAVAN